MQAFSLAYHGHPDGTPHASGARDFKRPSPVIGRYFHTVAQVPVEVWNY
jgi:hypothetical protein